MSENGWGRAAGGTPVPSPKPRYDLRKRLLDSEQQAQNLRDQERTHADRRVRGAVAEMKRINRRLRERIQDLEAENRALRSQRGHTAREAETP